MFTLINVSPKDLNVYRFENNLLIKVDQQTNATDWVDVYNRPTSLLNKGSNSCGSKIYFLF